MSYGAYTLQTAQEAAGLVNLYADGSPDAGAVLDLLHLYALEPADVGTAQFADLAMRLRGVFTATARAEQLQRLNALLEEFRPSPRLVEHDGQDPHFHYETIEEPATGATVQHVGASLTMALAGVLVEMGADRFGGCAAPGCDQVFIDTSRSGRRRFCGKTCASRVHVAAHRAHQAAAG